MSTQTWLVVNDIQFPFHSEQALSIMKRVVRDVSPTGVVLNGDIVDCYTVSQFTRSPYAESSLTDEIELAKKFMAWACEFSRPDRRIWIGGNHEDRIRRYVWENAASLGMLPGLQFETLFHLTEFGFKWVPYGGWIRLGHLIVTHGSMVRRHSAYTARAHYERFGTSVLIGHTHRLGQYHIRTATADHVAIENGCLCSLSPEYDSYPNWQQGFAFVHVHRDGLFSVEQVRILQESFAVFGGKVYGTQSRTRKSH